MQRFFIETDIHLNASIKLSPEIEYQCKRVLRYSDNQEVELVDLNKQCAKARLRFKNDGLYADIVERLDVKESDLKIVLIQALIKKDKWEFTFRCCV